MSGGVDTAIEEHGSDHGLAGIGQKISAAAPALLCLGARDPQIGSESDRIGNPHQRLLAHQSSEAARQRAFGFCRIGMKDHVGDDQTQDAVAQEFQALIGGFRGGAGVGQRLFEKFRPFELVTKGVGEGPAHWIRSKSRE